MEHENGITEHEVLDRVGLEEEGLRKFCPRMEPSTRVIDESLRADGIKEFLAAFGRKLSSGMESLEQRCQEGPVEPRTMPSTP